MSPILTSEDDPRVGELRRRLNEFYTDTREYRAFTKINKKTEYWNPVTARVREILGKKPTCDVLEIGAGITGYANSLQDLRSRVRFVVQDVTSQNEEQLRTLADEVFIGDVAGISDRFDVIFSTFVFEHVTTPRATLEHLLGMLNPGGSLFIACPRYGFPLYTPPSARHYGAMRRFMIAGSLAMNRLRSIFSGRPAFVIHIDPAVFHGSWFRDSDAIHWPSMGDLKKALPDGYGLRHVRIATGKGLKGWMYRAFLLLSVEIRREE